MIVIDSSVIYALLDRRDNRHAESVMWYAETQDELSTTPLVLAEIDHLLARRVHHDEGLRAFRRDVAGGAYHVDWWPRAAAESVAIAEHYADSGLSLTDASLVALAGRLETTAVATFDERHFRTVVPLGGGSAFRLLPADGS